METPRQKRTVGPPKRFDDDPLSWLPVRGSVARTDPPIASTSSAPPPSYTAPATPAVAATPAAASESPAPSGRLGKRNRRAWAEEEERLLAKYTRGEDRINWSEVQRKLAEKGYDRKEDTVQHHWKLLRNRAQAQNVPFDGPVPLAPWTNDEDTRLCAVYLYYREEAASGRSKRGTVPWDVEGPHFPGRCVSDLGIHAHNLAKSKAPAFRASVEEALAKLRVERSGGTPAVAEDRTPKAEPLSESQTPAPHPPLAPTHSTSAGATAVPPPPPQAGFAPPRPPEPSPSTSPHALAPRPPAARPSFSLLAATPGPATPSFASNPPPAQRTTASPAQSGALHSSPSSSARAYLNRLIHASTPLATTSPAPAPAPAFSPPRPARAPKRPPRAPSPPSPRTVSKRRLQVSMEVWGEGYRVMKRVRRALEERWEEV
ncbi:hypothetical protein JCM10207_003488 [Rhodosporidiobolus poonsookiae]